jgi:hypothetical protein
MFVSTESKNYAARRMARFHAVVESDYLQYADDPAFLAGYMDASAGGLDVFGGKPKVRKADRAAYDAGVACAAKVGD